MPDLSDKRPAVLREESKDTPLDLLELQHRSTSAETLERTVFLLEWTVLRLRPRWTGPLSFDNHAKIVYARSWRVQRDA